MDIQPNTVLYGRESSSNPRALKNQKNTIINKAKNENISNYVIVLETISGKDGMTEKLKNAISALIFIHSMLLKLTELLEKLMLLIIFVTFEVCICNS